MSVASCTIAAMAALYVESWAPEYGSPIAHDAELEPTDGVIDPSVEVAEWAPRRPDLDSADAFPVVAFVDGVRRVDARLTVDAEDGVTPGLFGSLAVGATHWDRRIPKSEFGHITMERIALISGGRHEPVPAGGLGYETVAVPTDDPGELVRQLHERMRMAEADLAASIADEVQELVIADGPVNSLKPRSIIGLIKTHRVNYLDASHVLTVRALEPGERTPLFLIDAARFARYSWYLKLCEVPGGHLWSGVVRCEVPSSLGLDRAVELADCSSLLLPAAAPALHTDPRAPQNLVPIAALERRLRRELGDPKLVYRALRQAAMEGSR